MRCDSGHAESSRLAGRGLGETIMKDLAREIYQRLNSQLSWLLAQPLGPILSRRSGPSLRPDLGPGPRAGAVSYFLSGLVLEAVRLVDSDSFPRQNPLDGFTMVPEGHLHYHGVVRKPQRSNLELHCATCQLFGAQIHDVCEGSSEAGGCTTNFMSQHFVVCFSPARQVMQDII